jgi:hypothetical protein
LKGSGTINRGDEEGTFVRVVADEYVLAIDESCCKGIAWMSVDEARSWFCNGSKCPMTIKIGSVHV